VTHSVYGHKVNIVELFC